MPSYGVKALENTQSILCGLFLVNRRYAEKAKSRPERVGRGIPACSGLPEEKEKSSNEVILNGELFSTKNNIAYPSEKSKLFLKINKKIECIYKIAGNDARIKRGRQDGGCGRLKNAIL